MIGTTDHVSIKEEGEGGPSKNLFYKVSQQEKKEGITFLKGMAPPSHHRTIF